MNNLMNSECENYFSLSFRRAAAYQEIEKFAHEGEVTQFRCFN